MSGPQDYSLDDVRTSVAEANGYTLEQIKALDFPPPDYDEGGAPFWHAETVYTWLDHLRTAMIISQRAHHPERFEDFARTIRQLLRSQE